MELNQTYMCVLLFWPLNRLPHHHSLAHLSLFSSYFFASTCCPFLYTITSPLSLSFFLSFSIFKNGQFPASFIVYFRSFQANITIFTTIYGKKCPSSIRYRDSNPQPLECESPPITNQGSRPIFLSLYIFLCHKKWRKSRKKIVKQKRVLLKENSNKKLFKKNFLLRVAVLARLRDPIL